MFCLFTDSKRTTFRTRPVVKLWFCRLVTFIVSTIKDQSPSVQTEDSGSGGTSDGCDLDSGTVREDAGAGRFCLSHWATEDMSCIIKKTQQIHPEVQGERLG